MTTLRVLLTGAAGPAGRSLARQLRDRGYDVIAVDMEPVDVPGALVSERVPPASDPEMIGALERVVREHRVDLVLPSVSEELPAVSAAVQRFAAAGAEVLVAEPVAVGRAHDKLLTAELLQALGVAVPRFALPSAVPDLGAAVALLGWPVLAKPRVSRGGRGVVVVRRAQDIDWSGLDDSTILQEFAAGTEYAPVVYREPAGGPAGDPTAKADLVVVLEKTGLAQGEVGNATGVRRVVQGADDVAALALAAATAIGVTGPADVDVRRLSDGRPVVLEVNARFGANSASAPELLDRALATVASRRAHVRA